MILVLFNISSCSEAPKYFTKLFSSFCFWDEVELMTQSVIKINIILETPTARWPRAVGKGADVREEPSWWTNSSSVPPEPQPPRVSAPPFWPMTQVEEGKAGLPQELLLLTPLGNAICLNHSLGSIFRYIWRSPFLIWATCCCRP